MARTNLLAHSGNLIIVKQDNKEVGVIQSLRMNDDYAPEPSLLFPDPGPPLASGSNGGCVGSTFRRLSWPRTWPGPPPVRIYMGTYTFRWRS